MLLLRVVSSLLVLAHLPAAHAQAPTGREIVERVESLLWERPCRPSSR